MPVQTNIKNIIFDFGGVIINIDFRLTWESFRNYGVNNLEELFSKAKQSDFFDLFEKGAISPEEFRRQASGMLNIKISDHEFDKAWNAMILDIPVERINLLKDLKNKFRIFLLSNSNIIHYDYYIKNLKKIHSIDNFSYLFEKVYFSFDIGLIKPDIEIFNHVIKENDLIPIETLFIDDSSQHIEVAKLTGINTHHLINGTICDVFK